jgi:hypothetical protein
MTLLDEIVDGSSDGSVTTPNLLRKVQIAATRLGANEIVDWAKSELSGYSDEAVLPPYRMTATPVVGTFSGPMRSFIPMNLSSVGLPPELAKWFSIELRQPLEELSALAEHDEDPGRPWPPYVVNAYEETGVYRLEFHGLFSARNILTRQYLRGIIDLVRNRAMEFGLELQTSFPAAGSVGGPTLKTEPQLGPVVYNITNNITGHGTNVATGSNIRQKTSVKAGDLSSLRQASEDLGLSHAEAQEFADAVAEDKGVKGPRVSRFLDKVRGGAITVAGSVASDTLAGSLVELATAYLGVSG